MPRWSSATACPDGLGARRPDGVYGDEFRRQVAAMGIDEVLTAPQSPWQLPLPKAQVGSADRQARVRSPDRYPYAERLVGSIRRELLDHVIVLGEGHLRQLLSGYAAYYAGDRTHLSLDKDAPDGRAVEAQTGTVAELPRVGGLHHRYVRLAA